MQGQFELRKVCKDYRLRDFFYSSKDRMLCPAIFPDFLNKDIDPKKADLLSRPMRYHEEKDRIAMITGEVKRVQKKKKKEVVDDE